MRSPKLKRSSNSRARTTPPSEVTRDPWKSTFREALRQRWNGWFCLSPAGREPPERLQHVETHINRGAGDQQRFSRQDSNRKSGINGNFQDGRDHAQGSRDSSWHDRVTGGLENLIFPRDEHLLLPSAAPAHSNGADNVGCSFQGIPVICAGGYLQGFFGGQCVWTHRLLSADLENRSKLRAPLIPA